MRKNSENFDSIKQSIEMLLVTLNDKLANLARLVSILNSEESSDSLESAIQEKGITDHLINEVERKIQEIDFIARDNKKTSNKIDIQKIKSFKTKLKHIRKDFRKTVKKFEEGEKTTKRRQNYFFSNIANINSKRLKKN
ncbi:hypothetical protein MHBO_000794 [Bonamia ostreae]|uniref:Uncharacterized protein n=1 Tax=Bonamia ostreae TaxID=126728 RepID=A0ABV2AGV7_9EUKA